jgi:hypothetical protein
VDGESGTRERTKETADNGVTGKEA